jgi:hypothetical protein
LIVAGSKTIGADIIMDGTTNTNFIEYLDNTRQYSANTVAGSFLRSYTNTNMTINADGKITALSNGSAPVNLLPKLESSTNIREANTLILFDRQFVPTQRRR